MSSAALNKIAANSPSRQSPTEVEKSIAGALYDLETNIADMKSVLRPLQIVSAREVRCLELLTVGSGVMGIRFRVRRIELDLDYSLLI